MPRGGARPGAGAKPRVISEELKKKLLAAVKKAVKKAGKTPHDILADILTTGKFLGKKVDVKDWNAAYKVYLDAFIIRSSHRSVEEHTYDHRVVILPEIKRPEPDEIPEA